MQTATFSSLRRLLANVPHDHAGRFREGKTLSMVKSRGSTIWEEPQLEVPNQAGLGKRSAALLSRYPAEGLSMDVGRRTRTKQIGKCWCPSPRPPTCSICPSKFWKSAEYSEQVIGLEPTIGKDELLELLQGVLDPATHLVPKLRRRSLRLSMK